MDLAGGRGRSLIGAFVGSLEIPLALGVHLSSLTLRFLCGFPPSPLSLCIQQWSVLLSVLVLSLSRRLCQQSPGEPHVSSVPWGVLLWFGRKSMDLLSWEILGIQSNFNTGVSLLFLQSNCSAGLPPSRIPWWELNLFPAPLMITFNFSK